MQGTCKCATRYLIAAGESPAHRNHADVSNSDKWAATRLLSLSVSRRLLFSSSIAMPVSRHHLEFPSQQLHILLALIEIGPAGHREGGGGAAQQISTRGQHRGSAQ
jgi:hypothetical protein